MNKAAQRRAIDWPRAQFDRETHRLVNNDRSRRVLAIHISGATLSRKILKSGEGSSAHKVLADKAIMQRGRDGHADRASETLREESV